jgi:hypothetical protein
VFHGKVFRVHVVDDVVLDIVAECLCVEVQMTGNVIVLP